MQDYRAKNGGDFSLLKKGLDSKITHGTFGGGVVLVGGGSLLSGVTDLASEIFRLQARIGFPEALPGLDRSYINPKYATVLGLLKTEAKKRLMHKWEEGMTSIQIKRFFWKDFVYF